MARFYVLLLLLAAPVAAVAQDLGRPVRSPILTVESDRLYSGSDFGRRVAREIEAEGAALAAENREIETELVEEEQMLSERRSEMSPEDFRALADAFDKKVVDIRRIQDAKARRLTQRSDGERVAFLQVARPVLEQLMRESAAAIILERSSVFLSADVTDITDLAIARINAAIGDGTAPIGAPDED
ncbi:MAG: OmpH family outer membrane protein [Marinibacterium sp.]|nr:OmpH family outer membrane protein [Marinibacterium sp.]